MRLVLLALVVACGDGGSTGPSDSSSPTTDGHPDTDAVINIPDQPGLGAHGLSFYLNNVNSPSTISTPELATQPSGSTMIVGVGRGNRFLFEAATSIPTDNKGNAPYQQLGTEQAYTLYPDSGTATYAFPSTVGGADHRVTTTTRSDDEITLVAIEVIHSSRVQQFARSEVLEAPLTSQSVTTTGPATLVAFWWGDGGVASDKSAAPNNGFVVVEALGMAGELVQVTAAVKNVSEAGTYDVTWTATPPQGAQLWLVAVE